MDYKTRYRNLWIGIVAFMLVAWWLAFGKTFHAIGAVHQMENQIVGAGTALQDIAQYEKQLKDLEQNGSQQFSQANLFDMVTEFCQKNDLAIEAMPSAIVYQEQGLEILSNPIVVKGNYIAMVQLLYELEKVKKMGRVVSVDFSLKKNIQSRKQELIASIYLQNISNSK